MRRASYRAGVAWIAENDGSGDPDAVRVNVEEIRGLISVLLLADLFEVESLRVAEDVVRYRLHADQLAATEAWARGRGPNPNLPKES